MSVTIHPADAGRWGDLETLFESASATRNCWCMWWRIAGNGWRETTKASRRADLRALTGGAIAPGLLAYDGGTPVGWIQVTPRSAVPRFNAGRTGKPEAGADPDKVWVLTCFFTAESHRQQGLMEALARAACTFAAEHGATAVEAAPLTSGRALQWSDGYVGLPGPLQRAGFETVAARGKARALMRWEPPK